MLNTTFLKIVKGELVEKVPKGTKDAISYTFDTLTGSKTVYEVRTPNIEGFITGYVLSTNSSKEQLEIYLKQEGKVIILYILVESDYFLSFGSRVPSINYNEKIMLVPYSFEKSNGKIKTGITVYQLGCKLTSYYTGDNSLAGPSSSSSWKEYFNMLRNTYKDKIMAINASLQHTTLQDIPKREDYFDKLFD